MNDEAEKPLGFVRSPADDWERLLKGGRTEALMRKVDSLKPYPQVTEGIKALLRRMQKNKDAPFDEGLVQARGENVLLRILTDDDAAEDSALREELSKNLAGDARLGQKRSEDIISMMVVAVGAEVTDIFPGQLAIVYPAVSTRISHNFVLCPRRAIAGVVNPPLSD